MRHKAAFTAVRSMELEPKIERLHVKAKLDGVDAKIERVEQALEEGTVYLGTTDHVSRRVRAISRQRRGRC